MLLENARRLLKLKIWVIERWPNYPWVSALFFPGVVGVMSAFACVAFRDALAGMQWLLTQHTGSLVQIAMELVWWKRLLVPAVGGLLAGLTVEWGMKLVRGQSSTDYMEALVIGHGLIRTRSTLLRIFSSLFTIASGGSIGREGPMIQLAAMMASLVGRLSKFSTLRLRLLVACGAAAGIASAYKAPIAGALFVAEIILGSTAIENLGPLLFSSVLSTITTHQLLGQQPTYQIQGFLVVSNWEFIFHVLLGALTGILAAGFLRLLRGGEGLFHRYIAKPTLRLTAGGIIVGLISLVCPKVWGNGYSVVDSILNQPLIWTALLSILFFKLFATVAVAGSGAAGGLFTPSLFMGAALGSLLGQAVHTVWPGFTAGPENYALVGMGCFLAATTQAPLMAIVLIFEMTLQYDVVLPLMLACVAASVVARTLTDDSIYATHLQKKTQAENRPFLPPQRVGELIRPDPICVEPSATFGEITHLFSQYRLNFLYVTSPQRRFLGVVSLHDMKPFLNDSDVSQIVVAADFMNEDFPMLTVDDPLASAVEIFGIIKANGFRL